MTGRVKRAAEPPMSAKRGRHATAPRRARKALRKAVVAASIAALMTVPVLQASADPGGSGGTVGAGGGGGGGGYEYRFWSSDNGTTANTNAINDMMAWPGWGGGNAANRLALINQTCDIAFNNAIAQHGGTRDDYRIVLVGGFIGDALAGSGKVWYQGSPPDGMLNQAYVDAWPGLASNLNAITPTGTPERPNPASQGEIDAYRNYVNTLSQQALGGGDSNVVRICDVLKFDQPGNPAPQNYNLSISTSIQGAPTGPGQSGPITDLVSSSNGGSTISENLNGRQILYWDLDRDGVADGSHQKDFTFNNNAGDQDPGVTFGPADWAQSVWALGDYWIDTWIPQQGQMAAEVWHYGQNDPAESFSIVANPAIQVVKYDTDSGEAQGDRDTADDALIVAPDAETAISFPFTNVGDEPLTNITFADSTTIGSGTVEDIVITSAQGAVTVDPATGFLVVNGAPLVLAPGERVDASGVLRGVVVDQDHTNVVTVNAVGLYSGQPVTSEDPWNGKVEKPALSLEKWNTEDGFPGGDRDTAEDALMIPLDEDGVTAVDVPITYTIPNGGDVGMTNLVFSDTVTAGTGTVEDLVYTAPAGEATVGPDGYLVIGDAPLVLAPGETLTVTGVLRGVTGPEDHVNMGRIAGVSVVSGAEIVAEDPWNGKVERPSIDTEKWDDVSGPVEGDRDEATDPLVIEADGDTGVGVEQIIHFDHTNDGTVALTDLVVIDETTDGSGTVEDITYTSDQGEVTVDPETGFLMVDGEPMILAPGEVLKSQGILRGVAVGDIHTNLVTITGKSVLSGTSVSDEDPWNGIVENPSISLIKFDTASGQDSGDRNEPGQALTVTGDTEIGFLITNTGNVVLDNLIFGDSTTAGTGSVDKATLKFSSAQGEVVYDVATGLVSLKGADGTIAPIVLAPGETLTATGTLTGVEPGTSHTDLSTIEGESPTGKKVTDSDPWNGKVDAAPIVPRGQSGAGLASTGADVVDLGLIAAGLVGLASVALIARSRMRKRAEA